MIKATWNRMKYAAAGLGLAAAAAMAGTAGAQMGEAAGFAELMQHDYLNRDMVLFAQGLDLDDGQRMILESLYEDYRAEFDAGWMEVQQRLGNLRDDLQNADESEIMDLILRPFENWRQEKTRIKEQFEQNVQVILNSSQLEQWPSFQRMIYREKNLHRGRLAGESVNLFNIINELRLSDRVREDLQPILTRYENELHEALQRRQEVSRELQNKAFASIRQQDRSTDAELLKREIDRRVEVRNVTDTFRDRIAEALPSDLGEDFRSRALEQGYPRIYRPMPVTRMLRQALNLDDLDNDVRETLSDAQASWHEELRGFNRQLLETSRSAEPRLMKNQVDVVQARQQGERIDRMTDPANEILASRNERGRHYLSLLTDTLTPEQLQQIPAARSVVGEAAPSRRGADSTRPQRPTRGGGR